MLGVYIFFSSISKPTNKNLSKKSVANISWVIFLLVSEDLVHKESLLLVPGGGVLLMQEEYVRLAAGKQIIFS